MIPLLLLALACEDAGDDSGAADPLCQDAPVVTWEYWGQGFLTESCQSCHAATAVDRNGAPTSITFDTEAQVWSHRAAILQTATGEAPTMPPRGGLSQDDRDLLEIWLRCWLEAP